MRFDSDVANDVFGTYNQTDAVVLPNYNKSDESLSCDESEDVFAFCKVSNTNQLPDDLLQYIPAARESLPDDYSLPPFPEWLDIKRVKRGQTFANKYMYGLSYADLLSLLSLFSFPDGLKLLIYTEKSHTPQLACERYLSTILRVKSWYETEIWNPTSEGYKNLKFVRAMHMNVSKRVNQLPVDAVNQGSNLEEKLKKSNSEMQCPLLNILKEDFQNMGPSCPLRVAKKDRIYVSQMDMSFTQFGFFGLILVYPEKFGAKKATDGELGDFVHLWRYIGYMLGIKDEYNACKGELNEVRQRSRHFIDYFLRPLVLQVNYNWEHMARCAFQGIEKFTKWKTNFEAIVLYMCWVLDIETPYLLQHVGWKEMMFFNMTKFVMTKGHKILGFGAILNYAIKKNIERAAKEKKKRKP